MSTRSRYKALYEMDIVVTAVKPGSLVMQRCYMKCERCQGQSEIVVIPAGRVTDLFIYHEETCPFLHAIEAGKGSEWVKTNGYPIRIVYIDD